MEHARLACRRPHTQSCPRVPGLNTRDDVAGGEPLGTAPPLPNLTGMASVPCRQDNPLRVCVAVGCRHLHREEVRQPRPKPGLHLAGDEGKAWRRQRSGHGEEERPCHFASGGVFATASQSSTGASVQGSATLLGKRAER